MIGNLGQRGEVYQAGELAGTPLATGPGRAGLSGLEAEGYGQLVAGATVLAEGLRSAADAARVPVVVPQVGPLVGLFFGDTAPTDYSSARASVLLGHYPAFFHGMLDRGIAMAPGPYEVMFPSLAHGPAELSRTVDAAHEAMADLAAGA